MKRTDLKAKKALYSSVPQIRGKGIDYLTKKNHNQQFHENYISKMDKLTREKAETVQRLEDLEFEIKRLDGEEQAANLMQADKKKLKKLIPIYREKRAAKDMIKKLKEELDHTDQKIKHVSNLESNLALKENIFHAINIDVDKLRSRQAQTSNLDRYFDKKIDVARLKKIKRGLYLDILETASSNKVSFKKYEKKYDVNQIIEKEKQYKQEQEVKLETAALRHKVRVDRLEKRVVQMKIMRNKGDYNPTRASLYPPELDDLDYQEYAERGLSAGTGSYKHGGNLF